MNRFTFQLKATEKKNGMWFDLQSVLSNVKIGLKIFQQLIILISE